MAKYNIGDNVYWNDPDDGICSGNYVITHIDGDIFTLTNNAGSLVEATRIELSNPI